MGFGERLQRAMDARGYNQSSLARASGVPQGTISRLLKAKRPSSKTVELARALGVRPEWLADGEEPMEAAATATGFSDDQVAYEVIRATPPDDEVIMVPLLDIRVAAGPGNLVESEAVLERVPIPAFLLRRIVRVDPNSLVLVSATGDSMEPTIREGEMLLVDTSVHDVGDAGIYIVVIDSEASVKRVQRVPGARLAIRSDNPAYEPIVVDAQTEARIAGRVRSVWRAV